MGGGRSMTELSFVVITAALGSLFVSSCNTQSPDSNNAQHDSPSPASAQEVRFLNRTLVLGSATYRYAVYVPAGWHAQTKWPVIVVLHGIGERQDRSPQMRKGFGKVLRNENSPLPAVVMFPHCPRARYWNELDMQTMVLEALKQTIQEFHGDQHRLYLIGHSIGGYGTWAIAAEHPAVFAALVPIAGGIRPPSGIPCPPPVCTGDPTFNPYLAIARKIGSTPVWIFHGAKDRLVPVSEARQMVEALKSLGRELQVYRIRRSRTSMLEEGIR